MLKKLMILSFLSLSAASPLAAQVQTDTTYLFRFVPGRDMFYVPYSDNAKELTRLEECIRQYREDILAGETPLHVDGYCSSRSGEAENLATAKIRSNRVKSELIIRQSLTEDCFVTRNHAEGGDYVTVRIAVPKAETEPAKENRAETTENAECTPPASPEKESVAETPEEPDVLPAVTTGKTGGHHLALHANLLRWATLTPDLGIEWRINRHAGILVGGSWTSWSWDNKNRRYALWEVKPEVRWYLGKEKRGYVGAMYKVGAFNYKLSATGRQGDLMGGGITGGYRLALNRALSLDFTLGVGYIRADYEKYTVIDGVRVRQGEGNRNWWGPTEAGVTLVWTIF